jgi:hypothetical protein
MPLQAIIRYIHSLLHLHLLRSLIHKNEVHGFLRFLGQVHRVCDEQFEVNDLFVQKHSCYFACVLMVNSLNRRIDQVADEISSLVWILNGGELLNVALWVFNWRQHHQHRCHFWIECGGNHSKGLSGRHLTAVTWHRHLRSLLHLWPMSPSVAVVSPVSSSVSTSASLLVLPSRVHTTTLLINLSSNHHLLLTSLVYHFSRLTIVIIDLTSEMFEHLVEELVDVHVLLLLFFLVLFLLRNPLLN